MVKNTIHRIKEFIDYKGISVRLFEKSIGMSNGSFASQLKNDKTIGVDRVENILHLYNEINPDWLLTGNGSMLRSDQVPEKAIKVDNPSSESYPLIDLAAAAGFGTTNFAIEKRDVKDYYVIPKFRDLKIDFMIEVSGSSMYPKINSGDVVACCIIKDSKFIQWNKAHVISTTEQGLLVKRIRENDETSILAVSDNPDYPPFKIPLNEITGIALVVGIVRIE